jgi:hypothetical protein
LVSQINRVQSADRRMDLRFLMTTTFSDYRRVEGILLPHRIDRFLDGVFQVPGTHLVHLTRDVVKLLWSSGRDFPQQHEQPLLHPGPFLARSSATPETQEPGTGGAEQAPPLDRAASAPRASARVRTAAANT